MSFKSVAIDGPAGAGKSTLARKLAEKLGYLYVDTGAIYRTVALKALWEKADPGDPAQVAPLLEGLELHMGYENGEQKMYLEGEDVSAAIRRHKVSGAASQISAIPEVRAFLLDFQRKLAREGNVVMDGRDIGTVILPGAQLKVFLTASAEERARRRTLQLEEAGEQADFQEVLKEVVQRDRQDSAQLDLRPEDGVILDTTGLSFRQVVQELTSMARGRMENKAGGSE